MSDRVQVNEAIARLPLPLAQLGRRAENAKTPQERHYAAFYLWEATLKLLASAAVVEFADRGTPDPPLAAALQKLARPSLGDWRGLVRLILPPLAAAEPAYQPVQGLLGGDKPRADLPRLAGLDGLLREALTGKASGRSTVRVGELLDRLVEFRNKDAGHGAAAMRGAAFYERTGAALAMAAAELHERCDVLAGARLAAVDAVRRQAGGDWLVDWSLLVGEAPRRQEPLAVAAAEVGRLPMPGRVYLHRDGPAGGTWRELHPLVLFDPDTGRILFLNSRRGKTRAEYLCYTTGEPEPREDLGPERRALLARALGVPVAEADEDGWAARSLADEPPTSQADPAQTPRTVGEFELLSELGRGGMGVVYRAVQPSLGRQVALKVLGRLGDAKAEARFAREVRALGRVDHPNLVKVYTEGKDDLRWFYAMELVEGTDLGSVCGLLSGGAASDLTAADWQTAVSTAVERQRGSEKPLSAAGPPPAANPAPHPPAVREAADLGSGHVGRVVELVRQAAEAAHALHEAGVIHRDVKPGNVLLTADGRTAVLADLGLAQLADETEGRLTRTRQFVGTPRYASPEQVLAVGRVDRRTDVYGLGATLWELLTLRPLFGVADDTPTAEVFRRVQVAEPEKLRRLNPRVPRDLEAVAHKCLEKDADRRYPTAGELAADLARWQRGEPVQAQPPSVGYVLRKWAGRHRVKLAAAFGIVLLIGAAVVGLVSLANRAESDRAEAQKKHEAELAAERRQRAMNDAITAAMGGDVRRADAAIREAQAHGATPADVAMLRGLVQYERGNAPAAVENLRLALDLEPDSVAVRSLLGICYHENLDFVTAEKTAGDVRGRRPVTPHDFLFKGYLLGLRQQAGEGIPLLEEARRHHVLLASLFLARLRATDAYDASDPEGLERAQADLHAAKAAIRDNVVTAMTDLHVSVAAGFLYEQRGEREKAQQAWQQADAAAAFMAGQTRANNLRTALAERRNGPGAAREVAREIWEISRRPGPSNGPTIYALYLYRDGEIDNALGLMFQRTPGTDDLNAARTNAYLLAERDRNARRALAVYERLEADYQDSPFALLTIQDVLLFLGDHQRVAHNARRFASVEPWSRLPWTQAQKRALAFLSDELAEEKYLGSATRRGGRCDAQWWAGLKRLARGDRAGARERFAAAAKEQAFLRFNDRAARAILERLKDSNWPPWIPGPKP